MAYPLNNLPRSRRSGNCPQLFYDGFAANADTPVVGQFAPSHDALAVKDEHCRSRNVAAVDTRFRVQQIVRGDYFHLRIGQEREIQFQVLGRLGIVCNRIFADRQHHRVGRVNLVDA